MVARLISRFYVLHVVLFFVGFRDSVHARLLSVNKPDPDDAAPSARWLISQNSWGVLNTLSPDLGGAPFGNVVSYSDGLPNEGSGVPYFYLTALDPTAKNALKDERASFTVSEYPLGTCGRTDPETPTCAKITLTGKRQLITALPLHMAQFLMAWKNPLFIWNKEASLKLLDGKSEKTEFAQNALFTKHPEMKGWPKDHNFQFFKLEIEDIFLINWFGGPKPLTVDQYLQLKLNKLTASL